MSMEFSFSNSLIREYFEGSDYYVPSSELVYLHEHPLIQNSFLNELERMILETTQILIKRNLKGGAVDKFLALTIKLGEQLPVLNAENSHIVLSIIRQVYCLCKALLKQYNPK